MKLLASSFMLLALAARQTAGFTVGSSSTPTKFHGGKNIIRHATNVLEGKEIQNDFTPVNNMLMVKKGEVIDKTDGGIFLTGKVCDRNQILIHAHMTFSL